LEALYASWPGSPKSLHSEVGIKPLDSKSCGDDDCADNTLGRPSLHKRAQVGTFIGKRLIPNDVVFGAIVGAQLADNRTARHKA
jgi:hypothetical protein